VRFIFWLRKQERDRNSQGFFDGYSAERKRRNWQCLADRMARAGVAHVFPWDDLNDVKVIGTYEQVKFAFDLRIVLNVFPDCYFGMLCGECLQRSTESCEQDAFCWGLRARKLDPQRNCYGPREIVKCIPGDRACILTESYSRDPSGQCWWTGDTCIPAEWEYDRAMCMPTGMRPSGPCP
jgi:hypothetical protein